MTIVETRTDAAVIAAAALTLLDGLMTLPHWHLEGNPVVLALGPAGMMLVKTVAVAGLLWVWFRGPIDRSWRTPKICVWFLACLYGLVVTTNVAVLLL